MTFICSGFCLVGGGLLQCYTAVLGMPEGSSYSQTLQVYQVKHLICMLTSVFATLQFPSPKTVLWELVLLSTAVVNVTAMLTMCLCKQIVLNDKKCYIDFSVSVKHIWHNGCILFVYIFLEVTYQCFSNVSHASFVKKKSW